MWRNDVKDFMNGKKINYDLEKLELNLEIENTEETIPVKLDRPNLIFGITFLLVPKSTANVKGKNALHPITKEKIPIFLEDIYEPHLGIPAHK